MTAGKKTMIALAAGALVFVLTYGVALGITGSKRSAAIARFQEPESVAFHRKLSDTTATDPAVAQWRESVDAFRPLLDEVARLNEDSKWQYLRDALNEPGRKLIEPEWADVERILRQNAALLERLRAATAKGGPTVALDLTTFDQPHYFAMHSLATLLEADARLALRKNDTERAGRDVVALLQLAQALAREPLYFAHVVSMSVTRSATEILGQYIQVSSMPVLLEQQVIRELANTSNRALFAESAMGEATISLYLLAHPKLAYGEDSEVGPVGRILYSTPLGRPWVNLDAASYLDLVMQGSEILALPALEGLSALHVLEENEAALPSTRKYPKGMADAVSMMAHAYASHEARVAIAATGLALERHKAETGTYPVALSTVSKRVHATATVDPFSGHSLKYSQTADRFLLYSIGPNQTDDGGYHDPDQGDIVWRGASVPASGS